jgi:hypothetical protein
MSPNHPVTDSPVWSVSAAKALTVNAEPASMQERLQQRRL